MRSSIKYVLDNYKYPLIAVEVGTCLGWNAMDILNTLPIKMLYMVDPFAEYDDGKLHEQYRLDENYKFVFTYFAPFHDKIMMVTKPSAFASTLFQDNTLDYVYVDGNHLKQFVKEDLSLWWPKVKKGCIIAGHDYMTVHKGVKEAVDEFAVERSLTLSLAKDSDWLIVKV